MTHSHAFMVMWLLECKRSCSAMLKRTIRLGRGFFHLWAKDTFRDSDLQDFTSDQFKAETEIRAGKIGFRIVQLLDQLLHGAVE
jgi:hypothetical protein